MDISTLRNVHHDWVNDLQQAVEDLHITDESRFNIEKKCPFNEIIEKQLKDSTLPESDHKLLLQIHNDVHLFAEDVIVQIKEQNRDKARGKLQKVKELSEQLDSLLQTARG